jgi:hypothetical protein
LARLCAKVTDSLDRTGAPHAWTAAAAAALQGAGPTAVPQAVLRVDPQYALVDLMTTIGAQPADRGANLVLWRDVGRVGVHGSVRLQAGPPVAPPVRVYLDLLGGRRGEDAAAHYRELVLGY